MTQLSSNEYNTIDWFVIDGKERQFNVMTWFNFSSPKTAIGIVFLN